VKLRLRVQLQHVRAADDTPRKETRPESLTAYAKSKSAPKSNSKTRAQELQVTCLRFATACGMSDRLRLDLVVNDLSHVR